MKRILRKGFSLLTNDLPIESIDRVREIKNVGGRLDGRVVLLGSPLQGSASARKSTALPGGGRLIGAVQPALSTGITMPLIGRDIGMIAGSRPVGLGLFVGGLGAPGDGTVALDETRVDWLTEHAVMPVTHTGLVYSKEVAEMTGRFLETGGFGPGTA